MVTPPGVAHGVLKLVNDGRDPIAIARIESSCPCLDVDRPSTPILPGEARLLPVRFDTAEEPEFRGSLAMTLSGSTEGGQTAFMARVEVEVRGAAK